MLFRLSEESDRLPSVSSVSSGSMAGVKKWRPSAPETQQRSLERQQSTYVSEIMLAREDIVEKGVKDRLQLTSNTRGKCQPGSPEVRAMGLDVRPSSIPGAGLGVHFLRKFKKGELVAHARKLMHGMADLSSYVG